MSRKNNVNPDHYKVAGRDRPDDNARARKDVPPTGGKAHRRKGDPAPPNLIPGAPAVGEGESEGESKGR
jgi:hypothetical protein